MAGILASWYAHKLHILVGVGSVVLLKAVNNVRLKLSRSYRVKAQREESARQAHRKREERAKEIEEVKLGEISEAAKWAVDEASIPQIHNDFMAGKYTSVELLSEVIRRTADVGVRYNYISDVNFKWALKRAKECDEEREQAKKEGREVGILHGIPISVKD